MNECNLPDPGSSLAGQVTTAVRYLVTAAGGYMIGQGYLEASTVDALTSIATTAAPIIIGMVLTYRNRKVVKVAREVINKDSTAT